MRSKTKYDISREQVRALFEAAGLGEVSRVEPLSDGMYNNVLAVTAGGEKYVLKVAPPPGVKVLGHERELMRQELRYFGLLRERTSIRIPRVVYQDVTRELIPCDWFIMEFLTGQRLDKAKLSKEEKANVDALIMGILDQFHAIEGEGYGYEQMGLEPNWYLALRKMVSALVDDCAHFGKRCPLGIKLLKYIDYHRAMLEAVPCVLVNFDLHSLNIFYERAGDGGARLTIVDLERYFWGDWIGDCMYRGMAPPKHFTSDERIRYYLLMAYLAVIMYAEKYSRYHPWNLFWWFDIFGTISFSLLSFPALRRLSK